MYENALAEKPVPALEKQVGNPEGGAENHEDDEV